MLKSDQREFLLERGFSEDDVFDATGLSKSSYRAQMQIHGLHIAVGVTPCRAMGHTMRTRSGHCVQCNPAVIAYQTREQNVDTVYIAVAKRDELVKIGSTKDVHGRILTLIEHEYAGIWDWELYWHKTLNRSARIESITKIILEPFKATGLFYYKGGKLQEATEIYKYSPELALKAVRKAIEIIAENT